jgi:tight adherence protein B
MSEEVDILVKEYELGTPLDVALDNMATRINSNTLSSTILALKVARRSGGNLPEMLSSASASLREMSRLEGVLRTKTAEGKAQAFVIGILPIPMVGLFHVIDPAFFQPLFDNFIGHMVIAVSVFIWALAIFSAKKILAVDL